ncbi:response regulator transcription factor [Sulfurospirillum sp. 1307]|jgi:DNA-binding response OmpR family regulator
MECEYDIVLQKSSILLAEDDVRVRQSFKKVLLLYVDEVYEAKDGEEAFAYYKKYNPDIIISDIKMPRLSGLDFVKKVRLENKNIPIIVTSAYTDQDFLLDSIKLSLIEYAIKPITESKLNSMLKECAKILSQNKSQIVKLEENINYDLENKVLKCDNKEIILTNKEIELIELLLSHRGNLVTKQHIEDKLYIYEEAPPSALKNLIFKLRKKLPTNIIQTVSKLGYMIK